MSNNDFYFTTHVQSFPNEKVYIAIELPDGDFLVRQEGKVVGGTTHHKNFVERNLKDGSWKKVEKQKNQFSIKKGQIEAAARFIVANNKYLTDSNPKQVGLRISSIIQRMIDNINAGKEDWYCSTGGYTVIISHEDTNYYSVEINVDPSVSSDEEYVYVEDVL